MADRLQHFLHIAGSQGLSIRALSEASGVSKAAIYRYWNGTAAPSAEAMHKIAKALGCKITEAFPEMFRFEMLDIPTVNVTDMQPISTAKLAMQCGMTTRELNQALFRAGVQTRRSDGSWCVTGDYADMVLYKPVKTERGTVRLFALWTIQGRRAIHELLSARGLLPAAGE